MKILVLFFILYPFHVLCQNNYPYKNLALEGGGIRGLAYAGSLEVLEEKGVLSHIEKVAGSSAGAIAGLMISLGYNSREIDSILQTLKIQEFNDGKSIFGKIRRIKREFGVYKGDKFEEWLADLIFHKTGNSNTTLFAITSAT
jgi:NTE family protein